MKLRLMCIVTFILLSYTHQGVLAQESGGRNCPVITVSCPDNSSTGGPQKYKANIQGDDPSVTPTFNWSVSGGKITGGQGTQEVSISAEGNSITVTVDVMGYSASCSRIAGLPPVSRKFDEYGSVRFAEERARLDQFANELKKEPGAAGYILVYGAKGSRKDDALERGQRARNYLVKEHGFEGARIVVLNGGQREKRAVELFIVPAGAAPPTATPTVNP
ncbi:MAG: hypothetical protein ICV60_20480 [Pyrinomonadaceae bacterium]|nr:hypothetical protein [Pyrinomonadaceae bacterium]